MEPVRFESRLLPEPIAGALRARLARAHWTEPFSTVDARATVRRVVEALDGVTAAVVYRGGVDLQGIEVDHVWVCMEWRSDGSARSYVLDAAFPLHRDDFVEVLRRYVVGEAEPEELATVAALAGLDERVLGRFPSGYRYFGRPVWSAA